MQRYDVYIRVMVEAIDEDVAQELVDEMVSKRVEFDRRAHVNADTFQGVIGAEFEDTIEVTD